MDGLTLRSAASSFAGMGFTYPLHKHSNWELMYYREGRTEFSLNGELIQCRPGLLLTTQPGSIQSERAITGFSTYCLQLDGPDNLSWPKLCYDDSNQTIERLCRTLVVEWAGTSARRDEMIAATLTQLDVVLTRSAEEMSVDERLVAEAKRLIEDGMQRRVRLTEVAETLAVCPAVLRDRFKRIGGTSPMDYVQAVRLRNALALLRSSDLTLEAIAGMCGYHSASHLSRHVKAATGGTPGEARAMRR